MLEKTELTSGATQQAAGQIEQSTSSISLGKCVDYNISLYTQGQLQQEKRLSVNWNDCGCRFFSHIVKRGMDWLKYMFSVSKSFDADNELIEYSHIRQLHPFFNFDGAIGGSFAPDDGHVDASSVATALAIGAKSQGARIIRRCCATGIKHNPNRG